MKKEKNIKLANCIPTCVAKLYDITKAINEAKTMLVGMLNFSENSIVPEIKLLEAKIKEMESQREQLLQESYPYFDALKAQNQRAWLAAMMRFQRGMKWDDIGECLWLDNDAPGKIAGMTVYVAFAKLKMNKNKDP